MSFLKDYTVSIMVVSIVAILLEHLLPQDSNKKYCNIMIGLLVMLVILKPLTHLPHYNESFSLPTLRIDNSNFFLSPRPYIAESFEKKLALQINEDLYLTYGQSFACKVFCQTNDQGQITEISRVQITPYSETIKNYIAQKYGLKEESICP